MVQMGSLKNGVFEDDYYVGLRDIDDTKQITNKSILGFMEDIAGAHSAAVGLGYNDISKTHLTWILLDWKLEIKKRPIYDSMIHIKTWARAMTKLYVFRDFELYDESGELCAIATTKWLLYDVGKNSFAKIPEDLFEKYGGHCEKAVFGEADIEKLKEPNSSPIASNSYQVLRRDIDVNHHMHNLYYLDLAYEILPQDIYEQDEKNTLSILYKKEIKLGESIHCYLYIDDQVYTVVIKSQDDKNLHAIIKMA